MPNEDPYAKYLTPPQGAAPAATAPGDDPYAKYLAPPSAAAAQPDASSYLSGVMKPIDKLGRVALHDFTLGAADKVIGGVGQMMGTDTIANEEAKTSAAASSMPLALRLGIGAGAYALGPGKFLGPAAAEIGGGSALARLMAEGAMAGGISDFDPSDPIGSTLHGAMGGGAVGALAHGVGMGAGKLLSKPGAVDAADAVAKTGEAKEAAYGALNKIPVDPGRVQSAIGGVMDNLDPSVETGMSGGLKSQINDIYSTLKDQTTAHAGQVDSWQRQINEAANRESYPTDRIVAGQINDALDGVLQTHGAGGLQDTAQAAFKRYANAKDLQSMAQNLSDFGQSPGAGPAKAAGFYDPGSPEYKAWMKVNASSDPSYDPSYTISHIGGGLAGAATAALGGGPVGGLLAYEAGKGATKWATKGLVNQMKRARIQKAFQAAYPSLTGVQPTGAMQAPPVGDLIKNLMFGGAY